MKNKKDEYDEVLTNEASFSKRFRRLEGSELLDHKYQIAKRLNNKKTRVTIYFDNRVIDAFKRLAEENNVGYQTLINGALLSFVEGIEPAQSEERLKKEMLADKEFLRKLKTALGA